ncbi:MAG: alkaline phosphatase D family protein [Pseudomonadales bacterium]
MPVNNLTRRRLIKTVAIGTGSLAITGLASCTNTEPALAKASFDHGVASGDPGVDRAVIWTRAESQDQVAAVEIEWQVATDSECQNIVGRGRETTDASRDYTLKLDVTGLNPGQRYYYRFVAADTSSVVGSFLTLPAGDVAEFSLAVVSCANYPAGFFNVYRSVADRSDIDAVVHLGDYIYEYGMGGYATSDAEAMGRVPSPVTEIQSLADYRQRYAQYRSDSDLQHAHQRHAFICVWDDHEFANDSWRDGAENHQSGEGGWAQRKAAAIQAYYEWMPVREPIGGERANLYRRLQVGNLLDLYMLDTRIVGRDKPLEYSDYIDKETGAFDGERFQSELTNPARAMMGEEQFNWLKNEMQASSSTWQVLGQQTLIGRMVLPAPVVTRNVSFGDYAQMARIAQEQPEALSAEQQMVLQQPLIPYNLDAWDGYPVERERLLNACVGGDKNLVVFAGDSHNGWANNITTQDGVAVGVEFATSSVSSPGLEAYLDEVPDELAAGMVELIDGLQYAQTSHRGFMLVKFSAAEVQAQWHYVNTVADREFHLLDDQQKLLSSRPGKTERKILFTE